MNIKCIKPRGTTSILTNLSSGVHLNPCGEIYLKRNNINDILSVQPMTGPVGKIFTMKYKYTPKSKYNFSRAKWYEADREMVKTKSAYVKFSTEQFSWCVAQFGPAPDYPDAWSRWYMINDRYRFRDEKDYIWFMLRWS